MDRVEQLEQQVALLTEQNDKFREELARLYGIDRPFVCGNTGSIDPEDNMPVYILVCPAYGADGFAIYRKHRNYESPDY